MASKLKMGLGLGSGPYTLPNGTEPLIVLDFKNGVYQANGDTVTVDDLLVENADYGTWNPAKIVNGTGLTGGTGASPVFTGEALSLVLGGSTILTALNGNAMDSISFFRYEMVDDLVEYNSYYYSNVAFAVETPQSYIGDQTNPDVPDDPLSDGAHNIALTMTNGKISRSTDAAAIITVNPAAAWSPMMAQMGFVVPSGWVVESINLYPAQSDADLPTLSA